MLLLPRKVTASHFLFFSKFAPRHTNWNYIHRRRFRSALISTTIVILVETWYVSQKQLWGKGLKSKSQWYSDTQHLRKTTLEPQSHWHSEGKWGSHKTLHTRSKIILHMAIQNLLQKITPSAGPYQSHCAQSQWLGDGCERENNIARTQLFTLSKDTRGPFTMPLCVRGS